MVSAIINGRLQKLQRAVDIDNNGFTIGRGCLDSTFSLKNVLHSMREHGQESWVAFIDLVKAFDSVDRTAMCDILLRYGAPQSLVTVIEGMHREVHMRMVIGDDFEDFESSIGVLQGAAASPVLFNFVIDAWFSTMEWPDPPVVLHSDDGSEGPHSKVEGTEEVLLAHITNRGKAGTNVGNTVKVRDFKYADDVAAVWRSREAMQRGMAKLVSHGRRWGLEVHVAKAVDMVGYFR